MTKPQTEGTSARRKKKGQEMDGSYWFQGGAESDVRLTLCGQGDSSHRDQVLFGT
jgi:hypothetical protein